MPQPVYQHSSRMVPIQIIVHLIHARGNAVGINIQIWQNRLRKPAGGPASAASAAAAAAGL